ncbi:hypothetical protein Ancab_021862 [Ancistrocladus abbreviatus]
MARSLAMAKLLSAVVIDNVPLAITKRAYAVVASQGVLSNVPRGGDSGRMKMGKAAQEEMGRSAECSWVPDPITGYYRPANRRDEIDVAELRAMFLKNAKH